ncbi:ABC transporter ATP-binding protein [Pseudoroseomonas sp. WGS1072]|uniref:ABC transporter ATP-binding protein n=1 Tax=Roseomonas sp. WGS1072 TaxID=3366816 RepID=UPI003BEFB168
MTANPTDLALSGLTKSFGGTLAVDNVTLRISAGEMVALLGPSGCGKTTTLRMVAGLVQPTSGDVLIDGYRVTHIPVHRRNIGMLFQNYALFPHLTVAQNVAFGLQMRRVSRAEVASRVTTALRLVQLDPFAERLPSALSGGQQQRVALARAIVIEPSLLLLDEPLGALDKSLREAMQGEIRAIQKRLGITAVMVTHDQEEAMTMADRIVVMRGGVLEQVGTPEEVYSHPANRFVAGFLGASNFLRGSALGREGGEVVMRLDGGGLARVRAGAGPGGPLIAIRPEAVRLQPASAEAPVENGIPGTVEQVRYRGQSTHIHLRLDDGESFLAYLSNGDEAVSRQGFRPGDRILASWSSASATMIADA